MRALTSIREGDALRLSIEKLVYGGDGFAHHETRACFVKNVIPGEIVEARVDRIHAHYLSCSALHITEPSPERTAPRCPLIATCGGCQWQHMAYGQQLYWKTGILHEALNRIARLERAQVPLPLAGDSPFQYRCRATLRIAGTAIGYFKEKSHDIVPVRHCPVLAAPLNRAITVCRKTLQADPGFFKSARELQLLLIMTTGDVLVSCAGRGKRTRACILNAGAEALAPFSGDAVETIDGMLFKRDTESFYQINYGQNLNLIRLVRDCIAPAPGDAILELYCGSGNFSLFLAREGASVTGIEANSAAVREARENAALNRVSTCDFIQADVSRLDALIFKKKYSALLLNPPRTGCPRELLAQVASAQPPVIVYVSCNPATLSRDLRELVDRGYAIREIQPVDMFPQTWHIETVVKLSKNSS